MAFDWRSGNTGRPSPKRGRRTAPAGTQSRPDPPPQPELRKSERRQEPEVPTRRRRKAHGRSTLACFCADHPDLSCLIVVVTALTVILVVVLLWKGWDLWTFLWHHKRWSVGAVLAPVGYEGMKSLLKQYGPEKGELTASRDPTQADAGGEKAAKSGGKMAAPGESWVQSSGYVMRGLGNWLLNNRLVRTVAVAAVVILASSGLAHTFYQGVNIPGLRAVFEEQEKQPDIPNGEKAPPEKKADLPAEKPEDDGEPEMEAQADFLLEPDRYYVLSDEEAGRLFFRTGSYAVTEGAGAGDIAEKLKPFVEELLAVRKENLFDEYAPEDIKGEIAGASQLEGKMTDSGELDQVISVRMDVWPDYPKYRIAKLLANNMQTYAKEYTEIGGKYETIKYYHAQSVFWTWESLTFESVTEYTLKSDLDYIRMRYHDIADAAMFGSEDQLRASVLSEAFGLLENMEFSFGEALPPNVLPEDGGIPEYE